MKIGFIGLGKMGTPMALNLIKAGFEVHAFNRTPGKSNLVEAAGALTFHQIEDAVKDVDVVVTMVSDDAALRSVSQLMNPFLKRGCVHLSMSTIAPSTAASLSKEAENFSIAYVSAPVMGRPPAAEAGKLFVLVSGNSEGRKMITPLLDAMGQRIFDFGPDPTSANLMKLLANYLIFASVEMLSEVMLAAEKGGMDKSKVLDTLTSTIFAAPVFKTYGPLIVEEKEILNGFATTLASKDLRLMLETASSFGAQLPVGEVVQSHLKKMIEVGHGDRDVSALITHLRHTQGPNGQP